jgi:hypothetical protein
MVMLLCDYLPYGHYVHMTTSIGYDPSKLTGKTFLCLEVIPLIAEFSLQIVFRVQNLQNVFIK